VGWRISADADDQHIVAYSISQGNVINVVAFASELDKEDQDYGEEWVTDCTKDEMLQVGCFPLRLWAVKDIHSVSGAGKLRRWRCSRLAFQN
jgi:hypothetical protein